MYAQQTCRSLCTCLGQTYHQTVTFKSQRTCTVSRALRITLSPCYSSNPLDTHNTAVHKNSRLPFWTDLFSSSQVSRKSASPRQTCRSYQVVVRHRRHHQRLGQSVLALRNRARPQPDRTHLRLRQRISHSAHRCGDQAASVQVLMLAMKICSARIPVNT
jgi:hypothetical protein